MGNYLFYFNEYRDFFVIGFTFFIVLLFILKPKNRDERPHEYKSSNWSNVQMDINLRTNDNIHSLFLIINSDTLTNTKKGDSTWQKEKA